MVKKKEVLEENILEVSTDEKEVVKTPGVLTDSIQTQEFFNQNRELLFKEVAGLVVAEFHDNPPRVLLVVTKELSKLPEYEYKGIKIEFEQMILGGVVSQRDNADVNVKYSSVSTPKTIEGQKIEDVLGKKCVGPHNVSGKGEVFEKWQERYGKFIKVIGEE